MNLITFKKFLNSINQDRLLKLFTDDWKRSENQALPKHSDYNDFLKWLKEDPIYSALFEYNNFDKVTHFDVWQFLAITQRAKSAQDSGFEYKSPDFLWGLCQFLSFEEFTEKDERGHCQLTAFGIDTNRFKAWAQAHKLCSAKYPGQIWEFLITHYHNCVRNALILESEQIQRELSQMPGIGNHVTDGGFDLVLDGPDKAFLNIDSLRFDGFAAWVTPITDKEIIKSTNFGNLVWCRVERCPEEPEKYTVLAIFDEAIKLHRNKDGQFMMEIYDEQSCMVIPSESYPSELSEDELCF